MTLKPVVHRGFTLGVFIHRARIVAFYVLSGLLTTFLSIELFAHLLLPTPVVTDWAHGHHFHALAHFVLTALLIPAIGCGLHRRLRRIAGLQELLLVAGLGLAVSTNAWKGLHDLDFPVANFSLYGGIALIVALLHPQRRRLFAGGSFEPYGAPSQCSN